MSCEKVSELLPELLAGALGREEELEVLTHLAQCAECRAELAFWAQVAQAAQMDAAEALPEEVFSSVQEKLFGQRMLTAKETLRMAGQALGLVRSACRLAISATGL